MRTGQNDIATLLIVTAIVILFLAAFVITLIYLYQRKQLLHLQKVNTLQLNHQKNVLAAQAEMQQATFQEISREIHDNINHLLLLSKKTLISLNMLDERDAEKKVNLSIDLISKSMTDLNDLSKSLDSELIKNPGFTVVLQKKIESIKMTGLFNIDLQITGQPGFMHQKEMIIFRIIQEAFNNIIKHSQAKNIKLCLCYHDSHLDLTITDDGKGFDMVEKSMNGAGLNNIKLRTNALQGKINITSVPGKGTSIHISIPYQS